MTIHRALPSCQVQVTADVTLCLLHQAGIGELLPWRYQIHLAHCSVPAAQRRAWHTADPARALAGGGHSSAGTRQQRQPARKPSSLSQYQVSLLQTRGSHHARIMVSVGMKQVRCPTQHLAHRKRTMPSNLNFFFFLFHPRTTEKQLRASQKAVLLTFWPRLSFVMGVHYGVFRVPGLYPLDAKSRSPSVTTKTK